MFHSSVHANGESEWRLYLPTLSSRSIAAPHLPSPIPTWDDLDVRTLIITDLPTLAAETAHSPFDLQIARLRDRLGRLAQHPEVAGRLIFVVGTETDDQVADAFEAWRGNQDPARWTRRANTLALALANWIMEQRATRHPNLDKVLIVGDDRIVPHFRLRIDAPFQDLGNGWVTEHSYFREGTVSAGTAIGSALAEDMTLTDDVYGSVSPQAWGEEGLELYFPELAVGRLVERPAEMLAVIESFLDSDGRMPIQRSLLAGYDFMQDAIEAGDRRLAEAGLPSQRRELLLGNTWTVGDLRERLEGTFDLFLYAVHATHYDHETPNSGILRAAELAESLRSDPKGRVAYGLACHAGLNVPGDDHPEPVDFPEVWQAAGAHYVATTGWAYGYDGQLQYHERFLVQFTKALTPGEPVTLGEAMVETKRRYAQEAEDQDHLHAKTLAGTVLYGLPMVEAELVTSSSSKEAAPIEDEAAPVKSAAALAASSVVDLDRSEAAAALPGLEHQRWTLEVPINRFRREPSGFGEIVSLPGLSPHVQAGTPLQPMWSSTSANDHDSPTDLFDARGILWLRGDYIDLPNFEPVLQRARLAGQPASSPGPAAGLPSSGGPGFDRQGWYPDSPPRLHRLAPGGSSSSSGPAGTYFEPRMQVTLGQYHAGSRVERLYHRIEMEVYRSTSSDLEPVSLGSITVDRSDRSSRVVVGPVSSDAMRVVATWTLHDGHWRSTDLRRSKAERWEADLPAGAQLVIQAVDRAGNVSIHTDGGRYFMPVPKTR